MKIKKEFNMMKIILNISWEVLLYILDLLIVDIIILLLRIKRVIGFNSMIKMFCLFKLINYLNRPLVARLPDMILRLKMLIYWYTKE